jgi:glycosyltransferase involved in cell wall biosynthesis
VAGMTRAILDLADNPELRHRLGSTGRERFTDQFRHQTMTRRLREVYAQVMK